MSTPTSQRWEKINRKSGKINFKSNYIALSIICPATCALASAEVSPPRERERLGGKTPENGNFSSPLLIDWQNWPHQSEKNNKQIAENKKLHSGKKITTFQGGGSKKMASIPAFPVHIFSEVESMMLPRAECLCGNYFQT